MGCGGCGAKYVPNGRAAAVAAPITPQPRTINAVLPQVIPVLASVGRVVVTPATAVITPTRPIENKE